MQFPMKRYCANPIAARRPCAGPEVTATGVFADLLRVAQALRVRA